MKDGKKVQLQIYYELGMEGVEWSAHDYSKEGYEGLIILEDGAYLKIPNKWEGQIIYDYSVNKKWIKRYRELGYQGKYRRILEEASISTKRYSDEECEIMSKLYFMKQEVKGYTCNWLQANIDPILWLSFFEQELKAYYVD